MSELPEVVQTLEGVIGLHAALKLVDRYGGTRVWVPALVDADHPLAKLLGEQEAQGVAQIYGRRWLSVPRCAALLRAERARQVRARYDAGDDPRTLARAYRLTERTIWRILGSPSSDGRRKRPAAVDPRQRDLFDPER